MGWNGVGVRGMGRSSQRQQRRGFRRGEGSLDGTGDEGEGTTSFLRTSGHRGPDTLTPLSSRQPSGALSDASVDDAESQGAFGYIVGGINLGICDKGEVFLSMFSKAFRQCSGIPTSLCSFGHF